VHRTIRLLGAAAVTVAAAGALGTSPWRAPDARDRALQRWFRMLLTTLQIRTEVAGDNRFASRGVGVLVVSNHMSWLDVIALGAVQPLRMVGKREVRKWAVIGPLAATAGTLFIDRERLSALPGTVTALAAVLREGSAVGTFPEGTTFCGGSTGRFRPAMFQAALDAGVIVRPVALRYRLKEARGTSVASFVGSASPWRSVAVVAGVRGLVVEVRLLPTLDGTDPRWVGAGRRALATAAGAAVHGITAHRTPVRSP